MKVKLDTGAGVNICDADKSIQTDRRCSCQDGKNKNKALWIWWNKYLSGRKYQGDV